MRETIIDLSTWAGLSKRGRNLLNVMMQWHVGLRAVRRVHSQSR